MYQEIENLLAKLYNPTAPLHDRESRLAEIEQEFKLALQSFRDSLRAEKYGKLSDWYNPKP